ncbi:hypothetical protein GS11_3566 [Mycobacterium tuberculosis variant bovis BCG]|nr:hypothetical protein MTBK_35120 [Mycobacterium tuberculosis K]AKO26492.1 hypothetical protein GS11_3566 [Mycobacterium tuberculosis variant bovis BCG]EQM20950.1 hypothetical protein FJ05194_1944 [Mycobacterium tuberculosis FJ05194]KAF3411355.1 hypothetical protein BIT18_3046 [Mycobacterium tuberculosis variant bovis]KDA15940.1 hypothetical protein CO60_0804 [Mycobacterium tuberculosis]GAA46966.1 hypothetical protein NCGM2209_3611 [Mycobacterium tuberculosis NCGM2209]
MLDTEPELPGFSTSLSGIRVTVVDERPTGGRCLAGPTCAAESGRAPCALRFH